MDDATSTCPDCSEPLELEPAAKADPDPFLPADRLKGPFVVRCPAGHRWECRVLSWGDGERRFGDLVALGL